MFYVKFSAKFATLIRARFKTLTINFVLNLHIFFKTKSLQNPDAIADFTHILIGYFLRFACPKI